MEGSELKKKGQGKVLVGTASWLLVCPATYSNENTCNYVEDSNNY